MDRREAAKQRIKKIERMKRWAFEANDILAFKFYSGLGENEFHQYCCGLGRYA